MLLGNKEREALQSGEKVFILVFHMGLHPCEQRISISINKMHIQGITRALKFTPDIKFVNDEMLNEFVVTVERRNVGETDAKNDRYSDREDRDKRDEEDRDNSLSSKCKSRHPQLRKRHLPILPILHTLYPCMSVNITTTYKQSLFVIRQIQSIKYKWIMRRQNHLLVLFS